MEKKIKGAVTDSGSEIVYTPDKPGIKNLIDIQVAITQKSIQEIVDYYQGKMYGHLKVDTAKLVMEEAMPIQEKAGQLLKDKDTLIDILHDGAERARNHARETLDRVYSTIGFVPGKGR